MSMSYSHVQLIIAIETPPICGPDPNDNNVFPIASQADCNALSKSGCHSLNGDVIVSSDSLQSLTLHDIVIINGNLNISFAPLLVNMFAPNMTYVDGNLILDDLPHFESIDLPSMQSAAGIRWQMLPTFREYGINVGGKVGDLIIANTSLDDALSLGVTEAGMVNITNNPQLDKVTLPNLESVSGAVDIWGNGPFEPPNFQTWTCLS
jgi:hypothetical protein